MARCLVVDVAIFLDDRDRAGRVLRSLGSKPNELSSLSGQLEGGGNQRVTTGRFRASKEKEKVILSSPRKRARRHFVDGEDVQTRRE